MALNADAADSRATNFNSDWRFALTDGKDIAAPGYDDSAWRILDLPHDWAIEGNFSQDNPSGTGGGALPGGIGWYRKDFKTPASLGGDRLYIDIDGAYMNSTVYINGHAVGTRPYGYASFSYDLTPWLNPAGKTNTLAVRVDNAEQPNSRWYSGCGIYRNVWLRRVSDIHVAKDGTFVRSSEITPDKATLDIDIDITNVSSRAAGVEVRSEVVDPSGAKVATVNTAANLLPDMTTQVSQQVAVPDPKLWSTGAPNLYKVVTTLSCGGKEIDRYVTTTGIRYFNFDPVKGFTLNGKPMKFNGVCLHHDAGALGAVVNNAAIRRQLGILKEMGVNAIRSSHNPPAPELMDLCDEMGLLAMDESFDMWRKKKTRHDYARYFNEWHERDLDDLIRRDRNHPSIVMWSIGNEVLEQWSDAKADTLSLEEANLILNFGHSADQLAAEDGEKTVNSLLTTKLADRVRSLDPTRPITAGCNEPSPGNHLFRSGSLDIIGFNYHDDWFAGVPENFPGKPFVITESVSGLATRGYYRMPSDSMFIWPERWDKPFYEPSFSCSSYDNCHVPWGNTHAGTMRHVENNDFITGQFVWTGFDYLGEPTPYGWPARSSYFGIVDLAGFPKDIYYMYQSRWRPDVNVLHLFPHWNWEPGQVVDVWAYYNNADEVELYLNGVSQGISAADSIRYHAAWKVPYAPGTLEAVSRKDGREVARTKVVTAGKPYAVRLTPDRQEIAADGTDLCYVTAEVVDRNGNLCPWAEDEITFAVTGAGRNVGVDNGSPISLEPFKANKRKAFYGKALIIVQSDKYRSGDITVTAAAAGLMPANTTIAAK